MTNAPELRDDDTRDFVCPHCGIHSLHTLHMAAAGPKEKILLVNANTKRPYYREIMRFHSVFRCVKCGKDTYILIRPRVDDSPEQITHQFPIPMPVLHPSVPKDVRGATVEAEKCLSVQAFNACGVMARRAIHALCQDKKAEGDNLPKQLEDLHRKQVITKDLREWADDLRILGRSGAHPEWEEVSAEDADYAVRFLREIIRYVYINPFEREQRRLKETKKKRDDPGTEPPPGPDPIVR